MEIWTIWLNPSNIQVCLNEHYDGIDLAQVDQILLKARFYRDSRDREMPLVWLRDIPILEVNSKEKIIAHIGEVLEQFPGSVAIRTASDV